MGRKRARRVKIGDVIIVNGQQHTVELVETTDRGTFTITCEQGPTIVRPGGAKLETT